MRYATIRQMAMSDRLLQIHCEARHLSSLEALAAQQQAITHWHTRTGGDWIQFHMLSENSHTQRALDALQQYFGSNCEYHLLILPVEAHLPRPKLSEDEQAEKDKQRSQASANVVREELEASMRKNASFDRNFVLLVLLSTLVAAIGMLENNVAVLVGAMVIAPFLSPNLALTFASAMGDTTLALRAGKCLLFGSAIAFTVSLLLGQFWHIDAAALPAELTARAQVDYSSIVLALASGAAAILSLSKGISSALVGVMVAAALLPPLAASGVFIGHGQLEKGLMALMLLAVNIVCINLAGLVMFIARGIGPRTWYEKRRAKKSVYLSAAVWMGALLLLVGVIAGGNVLG